MFLACRFVGSDLSELFMSLMFFKVSLPRSYASQYTSIYTHTQADERKAREAADAKRAKEASDAKV